MEAGVDVRFADLPQIEGATGRFLLQQMVAVAELKAGMISARTKAALAAAKRRGVVLGGDRGVEPSAKVRRRAIETLQARADQRAQDLADTIKRLQAGGAESLRTICRRTERGWHPDASWRGILVRGPGAADAGTAMMHLERIGARTIICAAVLVIVALVAFACGDLGRGRSSVTVKRPLTVH